MFQKTFFQIPNLSRKHLRHLLFVSLIYCAGGFLCQCLAADPPSVTPRKITPAKPAHAKITPADNSRCLVCHINFDEEDLAVAHANAGMGCVKCHGESAAHSADEDNVTAPDIMFPKAKLNAACLKCHAREKLSELHEPVLKGADPKNKYCTDCHGEHRVKHRSRAWDKETGKLIPKRPAASPK